MTMKAALSAGLCAALAITSAATQAEDVVTTPATATGMMEQARTYAQQEGRYQSFGEASNAEHQSRNQYRNGADNDTGQGTMTRQRSRDGGDSGDQHRYGRSSSGGGQYGADNDTGHGTKTRQRSRDGSGSGSQHRYGSSSSGGGRRGGGGRH